MTYEPKSETATVKPSAATPGGPATVDRRTLLASAGLAVAGLVAYPWLRRALGSKASVFVARGQRYDGPLEQTIRDGLLAVGVQPAQMAGRRVLLKPNLVEPTRRTPHLTTHPAVVVAVAEVFRRWGATVTVGEAPGHVRDTEMALVESGLQDSLDAAQLKFADLNYEEVAWVPNAGKASSLAGFWLPRSIVEADVIVSLPKMKTHHWVGMTASMKNLFGTLPGIQYGWPKNVLHHAGIPETVFDINASLPKTIAVVDGIVAMEGDGPIMGSAKPMGLLLIGANPTAVDATVARIMGLKPERFVFEPGRRSTRPARRRPHRPAGRVVAAAGQPVPDSRPAPFASAAGRAGRVVFGCAGDLPATRETTIAGLRLTDKNEFHVNSAVATPSGDLQVKRPATAKSPAELRRPRCDCRRWALIAAVGLLAALAAPMLGGRVYTADDLGAFHLPLRAFYQDCLTRGERFDWSPQLYCGFYLTGEGQVGAYHPWHWLIYKFLPLSFAFDLECVVNYPLLLLGMYCLLRRWRIRQDAALFGATAFTFSGFCLLHFVHVNAIAVVAHLPWLLLAIDIAVRSPRKVWRIWAGAAIALLTASQLLLGYPQYVGYSLIVEIGYACLLLRQQVVVPSGNGWTEGRRLRGAFILLFWMIAGIAIGGVQLLPAWDALQESSRQAADVTFSGTGSLAPLNVVQLIAPYLFRTRVVGQNTHELGLYAGSVTLLLAVWCVFGRRTPARFKPIVRGALLLGGFGFLLAMGDYGPLHSLMAWLPMVNKFRFPCRAIVLVELSLAVLAAIGFMAIGVGPSLSSERTGRAPRRIGGGLTAVWALAMGSAVLSIVGPICWQDYVASPALIAAGPLLIISAAALITLATKDVRWARPGAHRTCRPRFGILRIELRRSSARNHTCTIHRGTPRPAWADKRSRGRRSGSAQQPGPAPRQRIAAIGLAPRRWLRRPGAGPPARLPPACRTSRRGRRLDCDGTACAPGGKGKWNMEPSRCASPVTRSTRDANVTNDGGCPRHQLHRSEFGGVGRRRGQAR